MSTAAPARIDQNLVLTAHNLWYSVYGIAGHSGHGADIFDKDTKKVIASGKGASADDAMQDALQKVVAERGLPASAKDEDEAQRERVATLEATVALLVKQNETLAARLDKAAPPPAPAAAKPPKPEPAAPAKP